MCIELSLLIVFQVNYLVISNSPIYLILIELSLSFCFIKNVSIVVVKFLLKTFLISLLFVTRVYKLIILIFIQSTELRFIVILDKMLIIYYDLRYLYELVFIVNLTFSKCR